jgi:16S rRNA (guanine(527)-N(7))-methyltransferase RsmG
VPAPDWFRQLLERELNPSQIDQLHNHYQLLQRWNQRMNLTTVEPGPEMVVRHYCESLFFSANLPAGKDEISVFDAGSGAGFPGIPMAVLKPHWQVTLIESNQRKAVFLREASRHMPNVTVVATRIERATAQGDWLIARAVDPREILRNIPRLAQNVGLMLGESDFSTIQSEFAIAWAEPLRLPWGDRRICAFGRST